MRGQCVDLPRPERPVRLRILPTGEQDAQVLVAVNADIRVSERAEQLGQLSKKRFQRGLVGGEDVARLSV